MRTRLRRVTLSQAGPRLDGFTSCRVVGRAEEMERYLDIGILARILLAAMTVGCGPTEPTVAPLSEGPNRIIDMANSKGSITLEQALVISEQERMGIPSQRLRAEVSDLLLAESEAQIELRPVTESEDYQDRDRLLLILPAGPINGLTGAFVLSLSVRGAGPVALRRLQALRRNDRVAVHLETQAGNEVEGHWAYSRRPGMRKVLLASFDDPMTPVESEVFHASDFRQTTPRLLDAVAEPGWNRIEFRLPARMLEESRLLDSCERLLSSLDEKSGGSFLEWKEAMVSEAALDEAATEIESQELPDGKQFNLTLEAGGRETTRGKRLQPLVSYPITLEQRDGSRLAATLGCSISGP